MGEPSSARAAPRQNPIVNLLLAVGVAAAFAAGLEALARRFEPPPAQQPRVADYIWDWERMWEGDFYTVGSASAGWPPWEEFNADGLRDRTHSQEKPPRTFRLVFLGDSVTLGDGLEARAAYPQVLQERLDAAGRPVEVFNVALWGWSTRQQRIAYERLVRRYRPDRVVQAVCLNDIPELHNNLGRPPAWLSSLYRGSALVRRLVDAGGREIRSVEELFTRPDARGVRAGFARFFEETRALRDAVQADGAEFALIVFPFRFQLEPGAPEPGVQRRLLEFCAAEGLECLDLLPALAPHGAETFHDYDHVSAAGARVVAEHLEGALLGPVGEPHAARVAALLESVPAARHDAQLAEVLRHDGDPARRTAAAWALGRHEKPRAAAPPALVQALREDADVAVRVEAARALGAIPGAVKTAAPALFDALADPSQAVRFAAAQALAAQPLSVADGAVARLAPLTASPDGYVRGFAVWSLGELGAAAAPAVPELVRALRAEDAVPGVAAQALAKIGPAASAAAPALVDVLAKPDGRRRWNAAMALGRMGGAAAAAVPPLRRALRDGDPRVRTAAAQALGRIRVPDTETVAALAAALDDESEHVRAQAARALGWLGGAATPAVARLNGRLRDGDERVRREAGKALRRIQAAGAAQ